MNNAALGVCNPIIIASLRVQDATLSAPILALGIELRENFGGQAGGHWMAISVDKSLAFARRVNRNPAVSEVHSYFLE
jgi:hypothetical protein